MMTDQEGSSNGITAGAAAAPVHTGAGASSAGEEQDLTDNVAAITVKDEALEDQGALKDMDGEEPGASKTKKEIVYPTRTVHQKIAMEIDFATESLHCVTTLEVVLSKTYKPTQIPLHSRQLVIHEISVNGVEAQFKLEDPLQHIFADPNLSKLENHDRIRAGLGEMVQNQDKVELLVSIPSNVFLSLMWESPDDPVVKLHIRYSVYKPLAGIHFVLPDPEDPNRLPGLFTDTTRATARYWVPCSDLFTSKNTWEFSFLLPKTVQGAGWVDTSSNKQLAQNDMELDVVEEDMDEPDADDDEPALVIPEMMVVTNGELTAHFVHPQQSHRKVVEFQCRDIISPSGLQIAVGPFEYWNISLDGNSEEAVTNANNSDNRNQEKATDGLKINIYCFPDHSEDARFSLMFVRKALAFIDQYTSMSFPFSSLTIVVLDELSAPTVVGSGIIFLSVNVLTSKNVVDYDFECQKFIGRTITAQWFGQFLFPKEWFDSWLPVGLANYTLALFLETIFGLNEIKLRTHQDVFRLYAADVHQPPLCPDPTAVSAIIAASYRPKPGEKRTAATMAAMANAAAAAAEMAEIDAFAGQLSDAFLEWTSLRASFVSLKAPLVINMMSRRFGTRVIQTAISKIVLAVATGELPAGVSTSYWLRTCRKGSGKLEIKQFADEWIYASGCPRLHFKFQFNRKRLMVEVDIRQENSNAGNPGAAEKFTGPFMVRVHEPKGVTYDTQLNIEDIERRYDIQYHTKYKRSGQKLKKLKKMGIKTAGGAVGNPDDEGGDDDADEHEDFSNLDKAVDLDQFDRRSLDWIRWDPDNDWMCVKNCEQLQSMWVDQLSRDTDVVAQYDAIVALGSMPSEITTAALLRAVADERYFYRLRMELAVSLARCGTQVVNGEPAVKLLGYYKEKNCFPSAPGSTVTIPKPNKFDNILDYYFKKATPFALSHVRDNQGLVPIDIIRFILDLLKYNDNSENEVAMNSLTENLSLSQFSDGFFISTIIESLCNCFIAVEVDKKKKKLDSVNIRAAKDMAGLEEELEINESVFVDEAEETHRREVSVQSKWPPELQSLFKQAHEEVMRYMTLDPLVASFHNSITVTCLESLLKWTIAGVISLEPSFFLDYTQRGNFVSVRMAAIDAILILDGLRGTIGFDFWVQLLRDPCHQIRYHISVALSTFVQMARGDRRRLADEEAELIQNEVKDLLVDGSTLKDDAARSLIKRIEDVFARRSAEWKELRTHIQQNAFFCEYLHAMLRSPKVDVRVKAHILRFCEVIFDVPIVQPRAMPSATISPAKPLSEESAPKTKLVIKLGTLPSNPALEPSTGLATFAKEATPPITIDIVGDSMDEPRPIPSIPSLPSVPQVKKEYQQPMPLPSPQRLKIVAVLSGIEAMPNAEPFLLPVDARYLPDYPLVIKTPMDLSTVRKKLQQGLYDLHLDSFFKDMDLIFSNCYTYNADGSPVSLMAKEVQRRFLELGRAEWPGASIPQSTTPRPIVTPSIPLPQQPQDNAIVETKFTSTPSSRDKTPPRPSGLSPLEKSICESIWAKLSSHPCGHWFQFPVDPVALGLPTYLEIIKKPMDLQTVKTRLGDGKITSLQEFYSLSKLIFKNAMKFNPEVIQVHQDAVTMRALLDKEFANATQLLLKDVEREPKVKVKKPALEPVPTAVVPKQEEWKPTAEKHALIHDDIGFCTTVWEAIRAHPRAGWFHQPVDPVALNLPTYFTIIKHPMDLFTLKKKLDKGDFRTVDEFVACCRLIFDNAMLFNPEVTQVHQDALYLLNLLMERVKKRGKAGVQQQAKKPRATGPPQALASYGRCSHTVESIGDLIAKLRLHKDAGIFLAPVDLTLYPDYASKVPNPIDLQTMQRKWEAGQYRTVEEFDGDIALMFENCAAYNAKGSFGRAAGISLERYYKFLRK